MNETQYDPATGEITEPRTVAIDGLPVPHAATTAGEFINMIEDGAFQHRISEALADLSVKMAELCETTGKVQKGALTIKLDFSTEGLGAPFVVVGDIKVTAPKEKNRRTYLWTDEQDRFTRSQPRQGQFFGVREVVSTAGPVRSL